MPQQAQTQLSLSILLTHAEAACSKLHLYCTDMRHRTPISLAIRYSWRTVISRAREASISGRAQAGGI